MTRQQPCCCTNEIAHLVFSGGWMRRTSCARLHDDACDRGHLESFKVRVQPMAEQGEADG